MLALQLFIDVVLPLAVLAGIGWVLDRRFGLNLETIVKLTIHAFVPAFIFVRVTESKLEPGLAPKLILGTLVVIGSMWVLSTLVAKFRREAPERAAVMRLATMFYNCGNFGLPAVELAFGKHAAEAQVFVLLTMNITTFTLGTLIAAGHRGRGWGQLIHVLKQPPVWAVLIALCLRQLGWHPQAIGPIWHPLRLLADGLIPFMLMTLGIQLSQTAPPPVRGALGSLLAIRLLIGPLIGWLAARALHLSPEMTCVMTLSAAAPAAINTSLLAHEFQADAPFAAAAVFYTTVCSLVTVTAVLAVLRLMYPVL